ncbi:MAG: penicillin acylase family protein [Deltaproteobacteria bacterium]|nr:penicillin acylase family protein [Deltaproteobacteria bacterium]
MRSICILGLAGLLACNGSGGGDAGLDGDAGNGDRPPPERIEDLPIDESFTLEGLSAPVDAVFDARGIPHIYAADPHDALRVQGFLMARDRMGQMEFLRRAIEGRLAQVAGSLDPGMIEMDKGARLVGFTRMAQAIRASLEPDDPTLLGMQAFSRGVTDYIDRLRAGDEKLPGILSALLVPSMLDDWTPVDVLALARYESRLLSDTASQEVALTRAALGVRAAFPVESPDPLLAARAGALLDLWSFAPATEAIVCPDCLPAGRGGARRPAPGTARLPAARQLDAAARFFSRTAWLDRLAGGEDRGSNNWVVSPDRTASGLALLANDPHLSLPSPPVWYLNHINTARAGGDWDTMGVSFAGTPGVTLGFNRHIAWGATVTNYDVTDVYQETIVPGAAGQPDRVVFEGGEVEIDTLTERIELNMGDPVEYSIEIVPHHGPIIPDTRTADSALSYRWTGHTPTNELETFFALNVASSADEALEAIRLFECGSQNFVVASAEGAILWSTHSWIPLRPPEALSYDPATGGGYSPAMVLPGTGGYEWTGRVAADDIPMLRDPASGWIGTANGDGVGTSLDGNPFDDALYLGWSFDLGHRMARLDARLAELAARGGVTVDEMMALQADHRSPLGALLSAVIAAALDRAEQEQASPGSQPDLSSAVSELAGSMDALLDARDRLRAWSFATPDGLEGDPQAAEIADSIAASIFNATLPRLGKLAFGDEIARIGQRPGSQSIAKALQWAMIEPERLATYDAGAGDSVLWDDLDTEAVETRDERILRAVAGALAFLSERLGEQPDGWRWGRLHTIRFASLIPVDMMGPAFDTYSIPAPDDPTYPDGFPRHGDLFVLDACNFDIYSGQDFGYANGPSQRLVIELGPQGPQAYNALPGGQQHGQGPHHADEAELWRRNAAPRLAYEEQEVLQSAERRVRFTP